MATARPNRASRHIEEIVCVIVPVHGHSGTDRRRAACGGCKSPRAPDRAVSDFSSGQRGSVGSSSRLSAARAASGSGASSKQGRAAHTELVSQVATSAIRRRVRATEREQRPTSRAREGSRRRARDARGRSGGGRGEGRPACSCTHEAITSGRGWFHGTSAVPPPALVLMPVGDSDSARSLLDGRLRASTDSVVRRQKPARQSSRSSTTDCRFAGRTGHLIASDAHAAATRPTGKRSERSRVWLVGHESDSAGRLGMETPGHEGAASDAPVAMGNQEGHGSFAPTPAARQWTSAMTSASVRWMASSNQYSSTCHADINHLTRKD